MIGGVPGSRDKLNCSLGASARDPPPSAERLKQGVVQTTSPIEWPQPYFKNPITGGFSCFSETVVAFSTRFPYVGQARKKRRIFLRGTRLFGAIENELARAHQETRSSGGRDSHSEPVSELVRRREPAKPSICPLSPMVPALATTSAGLEQERNHMYIILWGQARSMAGGTWPEERLASVALLDGVSRAKAPHMSS